MQMKRSLSSDLLLIIMESADAELAAAIAASLGHQGADHLIAQLVDVFRVDAQVAAQATFPFR